LTVVAFVALLGVGALTVLDVVFVTRALHLRPEAVGLLLTSSGIGEAIGSIATVLISRWAARRYHLLLGLCVIASGLWLVAYAFAPTLPVAAAVLFLSGASFPPLIVSFMTLIQLETEDAFLGRVMSLVNTGMSVAMIASLAGGGTLADLFGVRQVIGGGAILLVVSGLLSLVAIRSTPAPRVGTAASAAPATTTSTVYDVTS
jgi:predicted MFS family arabinose efflux permease